jgi:hypothetical protein
MRAGTVRKKSATTVRDRFKQVNIRVEPALYQALQTVARQERRSVPQAARQLMEEALNLHPVGGAATDDTAAQEIARLAAAGGAFDWLADEPDLYDDTSGEAV